MPATGRPPSGSPPVQGGESGRRARSNLSNSPLRYPGGKFYARRLILDELPDHTHYCEPFSGGASIFFAKPPAPHNALNDLDQEVMNVMRCIRDDVESLIAALDGVPANKETYAYYKNDFKPKDALRQAVRWYYLNHTSYSGIMRSDNIYWGYAEKHSMRPENWPPHLRTASDKLQGVELTSLDFEDVIDALPDGALAFVDPPYYAADQHKFYNHTFDAADHARLAACLRRSAGRIRFLLTYDDHPDVRRLYEWAGDMAGKQWFYAINRTDDQRRGAQLKDGFRGARSKGRELFIKNYPSPQGSLEGLGGCGASEEGWSQTGQEPTPAHGEAASAWQNQRTDFEAAPEGEGAIAAASAREGRSTQPRAHGERHRATAGDHSQRRVSANPVARGKPETGIPVSGQRQCL